MRACALLAVMEIGAAMRVQVYVLISKIKLTTPAD
jgi:hypothetical protein